MRTYANYMMRVPVPRPKGLNRKIFVTCVTNINQTVNLPLIRLLSNLSLFKLQSL